MENGWRYYNHAMIPMCAPHECTEEAPLRNGAIWTMATGGTPLLARWTTGYDCGYETGWWYCIKDEPFDIKALKAKRRYVINQGVQCFVVKRIVPEDYAAELREVQIAAFGAYPASYRPAVLPLDRFTEDVKKWNGITYGAFHRETGKLCGYTYLNDCGSYIDLSVQKTVPEYERYQINAALVYQVLMDFEERLANGCYICDGERNILHETAFQDYLEKYFGFRKAYCRLHLAYRPYVGAAVRILYPFRGILGKVNIKFVKQICGVLRMEEIKRGTGKYER